MRKENMGSKEAQDVQIGVVSFTQPGCSGADVPGGFMNVSYVSEWVELQKKELEKTSADVTLVSDRFGVTMLSRRNRALDSHNRFSSTTLALASFTVVAAVGASLYTLRQWHELPNVAQRENPEIDYDDDDVPPQVAAAEEEEQRENEELRQAKRISKGKKLNI